MGPRRERYLKDIEGKALEQEVDRLVHEREQQISRR